ncbi:hypothetical protein LGK97_11940 [Clostridium sp. CS001]|uniref:hypothetical protein n=1 Tax=Clostridium sp. CS001 TaxID=2880648 RepID=UPI001CF102A8|nr:hypothetical protein [Clostridium sp. CS001]MCB2290479.1 hypothetical protein [Clostridium sp. CS001]
MSLISNIGILQNSHDKKAFSKISFDAGEKFNARVISTDPQKVEVNLKLLDGWQFSAKLDKPLKQDIEGSLLRFEVEGFEDDKLKIRLVYEDKEGKVSEGDILEDFGTGTPLSSDKKDALLFEKMIKHDMPLTKDNIIDIKNLVDFKEKIFLSVAKEDIFIAKYLDSRNIDINSEKGKEITLILKDFFQALKNLNVDEILLFKENNIELTKGNLESFIKLFKGESAIYNNLKEINNYLLNNNRGNNIDTLEVNKSGDNFIKVPLENFQFKGDSLEKASLNIELSNNKVIMSDKIINNNLQTMDKVQVLDNPINSTNLKEVVNLMNRELFDLGINHRILDSTIESLKQSLGLNLSEGHNLSEGLKQNETLKLGTLNFSSDALKDLVSKVLKEQQISLSPNNYTKLIKNLEEKLNITQISSSDVDLKYINKNKEQPLNKSSNDKFNEADIGSKNVVSSKVNGYGKNNSLNEIISMIKKELNVSESDKAAINNIENKTEKITTDVLIKEQVKLKSEEIKNMIRDVIENKLNLKPETYDKVMSGLEQRVNDIKMFNSLSEQYYYLDLPINVKEDEYQLKLIIKDDRKKGKKIDSKNVRIATSVKTINMGTVDAYIKINNSNMNIDISCDKFWVKVLDLGKDKLIKDLSSLSYRVNIEVNKKASDFTLTNCREFFDDRSFNAINIKV